MGIEAILRTEAGEQEGAVHDEAMVLSRAAGAGRFAETTLLRYLVPWGDTIFNQAQAPDRAADIRLFLEQNPGSPVSRHLTDVRALVDRLAAETHSYLWFIGD
jgi:hypothetical protein